MINKIKNFFIKFFDKVKNLKTNKWIIKNKINMLGTCYMYEYDNYYMYLKLVGIDITNNKFNALYINIPKLVVDNIEDNTLRTDKFGPYAVGDTFPYKELFISFTELDVNKYTDNICHEIDVNEFNEMLTSIMDKFLTVGY